MCPEVTKNIYFLAKYKNKISEIITFIRSTINALLEFKRGPKEQNLHSDTFGYIINLSSRTFSYSDFQFLNKKLIFCQTGYYKKQHFQQDLQNTPYKYTIQIWTLDTQSETNLTKETVAKQKQNRVGSQGQYRTQSSLI